MSDLYFRIITKFNTVFLKSCLQKPYGIRLPYALACRIMAFASSSIFSTYTASDSYTFAISYFTFAENQLSAVSNDR